MSDHELPVIAKTYELVKWSCQHTSKFPRAHRFVLGERIERRLYDLLETLIEARYTKDRHGLLRAANRGLEVLRYQLRLAHDLRCLRTNSYGFGVQALHEIGRMVGGWMQQVTRGPS